MQRYNHTYTSESLLEQFIREHHLLEASRVSVCVSFEGIDASKVGEIFQAVGRFLPRAILSSTTKNMHSGDQYVPGEKVVLSFVLDDEEKISCKPVCDMSSVELPETALQYVEAYKRIIENLPSMAWIGDIRNGVTIYANLKFTQVGGYTLEEVLKKRIDEFYDETTRKTIQEHRFRRVAGEVTTYPGNLIAKSGELIPVEIKGIPFIGGTSVAIIKDMRELKRLRQQNKELQELNAVKNDFLNVASHELRTPMTSIKGYLSMVLDDDFGDLNPELRETLRGVLKNSERLIRIINDMLDISKLESGKVDFHLSSFSLLECLEDVYREHENNSIAKEKSLLFEFQKHDDVMIFADADRFRQVMSNLIGNAFKFTKDGGKVIVDYVIKNGFVRVFVVDDGIGIALENHEKVFQKFAQIGSTLRRKYEGTGLGLAITKELVEHMGGEMGLMSEVGKGATFWFTVPISE